MDPIRSTSPRKLAVEWKYRPHLKFYSQMDQIGLQLENDFPDWERRPLSLEVRNLELHRRAFLSVDRSFFDSSSMPDDSEEAYDAAVQLAEKVISELEIAEFIRLGIRQWYALTFDHDMPSMVKRLWKRFFIDSDKIRKLLHADVKDVQYVVDLEDEEGWQCHFRVGPMPKVQWFQHVQYERGVFSRDTFKNYHESIPEKIVYVDLDYYRENVATKNCAALIKAAQQKSCNTVRGLVEYYNKG